MTDQQRIDWIEEKLREPTTPEDARILLRKELADLLSKPAAPAEPQAEHEVKDQG
jgi:hypothetical protein